MERRKCGRVGKVERWYKGAGGEEIKVGHRESSSNNRNKIIAKGYQVVGDRATRLDEACSTYGGTVVLKQQVSLHIPIKGRGQSNESLRLRLRLRQYQLVSYSTERFGIIIWICLLNACFKHFI